jgi:hypothetical protein
MIALCTVLSGGQTAVDMAIFGREKEPFLRDFLKLEHGPPSHDTFSRVFRLLDPEQFGACFQRFMARFAENCQGVIAIDGKVVRRSFDKASGRSALHMVSAWGCDQRLVLAQVATDAKSNEITAVPKLLRLLCLKGTIVTVDALNCQRDIARQIVEQGGDYAMALKGNQGTLHDDVRSFLDDPKAEATTTNTTVDGAHGRIETRTALVSTHINWLQQQHRWPGLKAIAKITRIRESAHKTSTETAADVEGQHPDLRPRHTEHVVGEYPPHHRHALGSGDQRVSARGLVPGADRGARLERARRHPGVEQADAYDVRRPGKCALDRRLVAVGPVQRQVVRRVRPDRRRIGLERPRHVGDRRQGREVELNPLGRIQRLLRRPGNHDRDRLTDMADPPRGERRHRRRHHRLAVAARERGRGRDAAEPIGHGVGAGEDAEHAGHGARRIRLDPANVRVPER